MINLSNRFHFLNNIQPTNGPIICWLSRDQRVCDNWALLSAQELAIKLRQPLIVIFCLVPEFLGAITAQYNFMLLGLQELEKDLAKFNVPLLILNGEPGLKIPEFCNKIKAGALFADFSPLSLPCLWKKEVGLKITCAFFEVDAHNIVPVWLASPKKEFGAYTLRPKLNKLLPEYLCEFLKLKKHPFNIPSSPFENNFKKIFLSLKSDDKIKIIYNLIPGEKAAKKAMQEFIKNRLIGYNENRNDPNLKGQSGLSPYLHFGHLSAQRLALAIKNSKAPMIDKEAFLEELIIRKELSDNFCFYNKDYDNINCLPDWAKKNAKKHDHDKREYLYKQKEFENSKTHDPLWNAAQINLVSSGKLHGYLRMYWAKKILEWTPDLKTAFKIAIYLNDKYALDGRDPNGYAGIAWSLGGVHDRAWFERPVFGQIRYMNYNGCKRKFDVLKYINEANNLK